jgi:anti-sigma regulatory factor (Ser/Thr protein kinase)
VNAERLLAERAVAYTCVDAATVKVARRSLDRLVTEAARLGHTVHTRVCDTVPLSVPLHTRSGWARVVSAVEDGLADALIVRSVSELAVGQCDQVPIQGWLETAGVGVIVLESAARGEAARPGPGDGDWQADRFAAFGGRAGCQVQNYAAVSSSVRPARRMVSRCLAKWGWAGHDVVDTACLLASELVANAVLHGCGSHDDTVTVTVQCDGARVHVSVGDPSQRVPLPCSPAAHAESGRGLQLVEALTDQWGVAPDPSGSGKRVWFTLILASERTPVS